MKFRFLITLFIGFSVAAQQSQIRFEHLDTRDGLSHNRINAIYEDEVGFIWLGTSSGLNRYDGTEIIQFDPSDSGYTQLRNSNVRWLKRGPNDAMWICTGDGIFSYNTRKERFIDITTLLNRLEVTTINLNEIQVDSFGNFWFAIAGVGVKKYNPTTDSVHAFGPKYKDVSRFEIDKHGNMVSVHMSGRIEKMDILSGETIDIIALPKQLAGFDDLDIFIDSDGDYWLHSVRNAFGCYYLSLRTGESRYLTERDFGSNLVSNILEDDLGHIIIGLDHSGLFILDKESWSLRNYLNIPSDPKSLSHNTNVSAFKDSNGLIWLGTNKAGVNYYNPRAVYFNYYKQVDESNPNVNDIIPIVEDKNGNLWMGSDGGGLVFLDRKRGEFTTYSHDLKNSRTISSNIIVSMAHAADSGLWIGTYLGGLNYFDFRKKKFTTFLNNPDDPQSISDNSIWKLYVDSRQNLWVGTHKGGVDVFTEGFKKILHLGVANGKINSDYITAFSEDNLGRMWIGTGYGVNVYDVGTGTSLKVLAQTGVQNSLSHNSVTDLYEDSTGKIWICTMNGLNQYDPISGKFRVFTEKDGLPAEIVVSAIEDNAGQMWFGTYKGISNLRQEVGSYSFRNFDASDGLQGDMFNERSVLKTRNGELVFGGKNGINIFNPEDIHVVESENKLTFLNFYLSNERIRPGTADDDKVWFENGLSSVDKIGLDHDQNSFTIEFASLNFNQDRNKVFRYRLKGFDDTWVTSSIRRASFTNLDPGNYVFQVMAPNKAGSWNDEGISMKIHIETPFWKTPAAYLFYSLMILFALLLTRKLIIQRERFRAKIHQERVEASRLHELDLMKIKFFTNISHEFRTPLTLILTPIERLLRATKSSEQNPDYLIIHRNARRLLAMVNQLLDFRKMEANQHKLSKSSGDLVEFIRSIVDSFVDLSREKNIKLHYVPKTEEFLTTFDRDKMEKIMFNLLSNAFKFTPEKGSIDVSLELVPAGNPYSVRISVSDTGIGIPEGKRDDIFKRFFQVDHRDDELNLNHGSGIGLSITREFVQMHGGEIGVTSAIGEGSVFTLYFPFERLESVSSPVYLGDADSYAIPELESVEEVFNPEKKTIFIVEDNLDFRYYLKDNLKELFNISESANGKSAWKKIVTNVPDLIITDIMMPVMNGIELCKKVKSDPRTAHIPVILLTAHYSDEQKIEGLQAGAIEYLTKPFNFDILVSSIRTALRFQEFIHESDKKIEVSPAEIEITSLDEKLIQKSLALVEENMSNADFSVQDMSRELGVSRGQLYKKILHITGQTPIEFIRTIRLKRAAHLLAKSQLTVAEVAYKVGFNNPKYFARYFKDMFQELPSKFAQKAMVEAE